MASIGHIAVGMAAARLQNDHHVVSAFRRTRRLPRWSSLVMWSALSMFPDADVIGFGMGVAYGDPWGHRGATHSLVFSLALGVAIGLLAPRLRLPAVRTGFMATLVLASHALLDTLTDGGLGAALFWPFDLTRYFAPWNPIPVSPIGLDYFSSYGLMVFAVELILFIPIFVYAVWPTVGRLFHIRTVATVGTIWLVAAWLIASTDPVREDVIGFVLREDTELGTGFSEGAFRAVKRGQLESDVRQTLGDPLRQFWFYGTSDKSAMEISAAGLPPACQWVLFDGEVVARASVPDLCARIGIAPGTRMADVIGLLGTPSDACWQYGRSPSGRYHRIRNVCFFRGRVIETFRFWSRDEN